MGKLRPRRGRAGLKAPRQVAEPGCWFQDSGGRPRKGGELDRTRAPGQPEGRGDHVQGQRPGTSFWVPSNHPPW